MSYSRLYPNTNDALLPSASSNIYPILNNSESEEDLYTEAYEAYLAFLKDRENFLLKDEATTILFQVQALKQHNELPLEKLTTVLKTVVETTTQMQSLLDSQTPDQAKVKNVNNKIESLTTLASELIAQPFQKQQQSLTRRELLGFGLGVFGCALGALSCLGIMSCLLMPVIPLVPFFISVASGIAGCAIMLAGIELAGNCEPAKEVSKKTTLLKSSLGLFTSKAQQLIEPFFDANMNTNRKSL